MEISKQSFIKTTLKQPILLLDPPHKFVTAYDNPLKDLEEHRWSRGLSGGSYQKEKEDSGGNPILDITDKTTFSTIKVSLFV